MGGTADESARSARRPLRVIDHVANVGGGTKYVLRLLDALRESWDIQLHSQPMGLRRYRQAAHGKDIDLREAWPTSVVPILADQSPLFVRWLGMFQQEHRGWTFGVREQPCPDLCINFFPWLHRHNLQQFKGRGVGVFHDALFFQIPELIGPRQLELEAVNLRTWFEKLDRVVVTSRHTGRRIVGLAEQASAAKITVIPVADTDGPPSTPVRGSEHTRRFGDYLVMPANSSVHKNHRVLLEAMSKSSGKWNLVLTGHGTADGRDSPLGRLIARSGVEHRVFGLGFIKKEMVTQLIADAEALVMPTLGEGGGSFPVCEAIVAGTPVITSNIDVIEEQLERMGAQASTFDPKNVDALVAALDRLAKDPDGARRAARDQVGRLHLRTWRDVAHDFHALLEELYPVGQSHR